MRFFEANGTAYMVMEFVEGAALPRLDQAAPPARRGAAGRRSPGRCSTAWRWCTRRATCTATSSPATSTCATTARRCCSTSARRASRASELTAVVTPGYAPFEQYHSQGNQGPWSDLYAFGGVLYWMVTGQRPARSGCPRAPGHHAAARCRPADRSLYRPAFLAAIDWALAPHEDQRPQSVGEWREALLGAGRGSAAKTQLPAREGRRPQRRFRPGFLEAARSRARPAPRPDR